METTDILFYNSGSCECIELIEDDTYGFYSNGTIHYKEFIESDDIGFTVDSIKFSQFIEK